MEGFETLQRMYRGQLNEKADALAAECRGMLAGEEPEAHVQALRRQLHQLSGSAGAYGYEAMGETARELEKRCVQWLNLAPAQREGGRELQRELSPLMAVLLTALRAAALPAEQAAQ